MLPQQDSVTAYLHANGESTEAVYFEQSTFFVGWRLTRGAMTVVYRFEQGELIICDFSAEKSSSSFKHAASEFVGFVHEIKQKIPEVARVKGRFCLPLANSELVRLRQRWIAFLEEQGAYWEEAPAVAGADKAPHPSASLTRWLVF